MLFRELSTNLLSKNGNHPSSLRDRLDRMNNLVFDDLPLGEIPISYQIPGATAGRYEKTFGEKVALAHVLVGSGLDSRIAKIATQSPPQPDFCLTLRDGQLVDAELGRIVSTTSARLSGGIESLAEHLLPLEDSNATWGDRGESCRLRLRIGEPPRGPREVVALAVEVRRFICETSPSALETMRWYELGSPYPIMQRLNIRVSTEPRRQNSLVSLSPDTSFWNTARAETVESFHRVLAKKARTEYEAREPFWLIMPLGETIFMKSLVLGALRKVVENAVIAPFSLLAVGTLDDACVILEAK